MYGARTLDLMSSELALSTRPPRPQRPLEGREGLGARIRRMARTLAREIAAATDEPRLTITTRASRYPY